jgi:hypothetical protein
VAPPPDSSQREPVTDSTRAVGLAAGRRRAPPPD